MLPQQTSRGPQALAKFPAEKPSPTAAHLKHSQLAALAEKGMECYRTILQQPGRQTESTTNILYFITDKHWAAFSSTPAKMCTKLLKTLCGLSARITWA